MTKPNKYDEDKKKRIEQASLLVKKLRSIYDLLDLVDKKFYGDMCQRIGRERNIPQHNVDKLELIWEKYSE